MPETGSTATASATMDFADLANTLQVSPLGLILGFILLVADVKNKISVIIEISIDLRNIFP